MELSREELERLLAEERRARQTAEQQTQPTTLDEYLTECHRSVYTRLTIETDPELRTKGSITNPQDKWCPTNIRKWHNFLQEQREIFGALYDALPSEPEHVFESKHFLEALGERISKRHVADEKGLENFLHNAVEDPVRNIVDYLAAEPRVAQTFDLGCGIVFENHPHALSELSEEVLKRQAASTPPRTPGQRGDLKRIEADQICIYRSDIGRTSRTTAFMCEYKPPYKLTTPHLRLGLRPMDIHKEVVNRKTIPTASDPESRFAYHADRLTASALTQIYNYMIEDRLKYGLLTNGEAFVWLKIDWSDRKTLYFHLTEPTPEVDAQLRAQTPSAHLCTAVGQYLSFVLMAICGIKDARPSQDELERALRDLKTWAVDFESTYRSIPEDTSLHTLPDSSPGYRPTTYQEDRSPIRRRNPKRGIRRAGSPPLSSLRTREQSDSSDEDLAPVAPETPTPAQRATGQGGRRSTQRTRGSSSYGGGQQHQYCTQKCLLGLVGGSWLDESCPNVRLHCPLGEDPRSGRLRHPVTHGGWLRLLQEQLRKTLDVGIWLCAVAALVEKCSK